MVTYSGHQAAKNQVSMFAWSVQEKLNPVCEARLFGR